MAEQKASVTINAPINEAWALFSHFNDYPKFMSYVKEVTYLDDQRSHWVVDVVGNHEWDAVNENWITDSQIGWRSTEGLENSGLVLFTPEGAGHTRIDVTVHYNPPAGVFGDIVNLLGAGSRFQTALQQDLDHFARMVEQAPPGALDPESSNYLFHGESAAARANTTHAQNQAMNNDKHPIGGEVDLEDDSVDARAVGTTASAL